MFSRRGRPVRPRKPCPIVDDNSKPLLAIDEYNVGPVLEKLLAMMQSMSMLLTALKNDLRHSNMPEVVAKKRDAATTQLWRAFVAYQKSFSEIEQFACSSKTTGQTANKSRDVPVRVPSKSRVNKGVAVERDTDVIELSESESEEDVACKRPRYDAAETAETSSVPTAASSTAAELADCPSIAASSSESSLAPLAVTSDVSFEISSDASASCVCVDPPSDLPTQSDIDTSEPLCNVETSDS